MGPLAMAVLLAWTAGFVDALGYLALSHVFTAHMSGNTVAAASSFVSGQWSDISRRGFPIPMFVLGVFVGALLTRTMRGKQFRRVFAPCFALEALLLGTFVALTWKSKTPIAGGLHSYPLVALLAAAMGLQNATLRHARDISVRTTFITGMLVNMGEKAAGYVARCFVTQKSGLDSRRRHEGKQALKYAMLWFGMFTGAICGGWLEALWGTLSLLLPAFALLVITLLDWRRPISEN
jgi:uncharacterized membrane protein YoaK (UPF0700 family)